MFSLLCPSRGRPNEAKNLLQSMQDTQYYDNQLLFYIQDDDEKKDEYHKLGHKDCILGPYYKLHSSLWNVLIQHSTGKYLILMGDDVHIHTKNWDKIIHQKLQEFEDDIYVAGTSMTTPSIYRDPLKIIRTCHPIISRKVVDLLGYIASPCLIHMYIDEWLVLLGMLLQRYIYFPFIDIEHFPYTNNRLYDTTGKSIINLLNIRSSLEIWSRIERWFYADLQLLNENLIKPLTEAELEDNYNYWKNIQPDDLWFFREGELLGHDEWLGILGRAIKRRNEFGFGS